MNNTARLRFFPSVSARTFARSTALVAACLFGSALQLPAADSPAPVPSLPPIFVPLYNPNPYGSLSWVRDPVATALSADGIVVVGGGTDGYSRPEAFRWTRSGGPVGLGHVFVNGQFWPGTATCVSGDGSIIMGTDPADQNELGWDGPRSHPFRWTQAGLASVDFGASIVIPYAVPTAMSSDGLFVVGVRKIDLVGEPGVVDLDGFHWTLQNGIESFSDPEGDVRPRAVSSDGGVVVGSARKDEGGGFFQRAFRWTRARGLVFLRPSTEIDEIGYVSVARAVSADGKGIAGYMNDDFLGGELGAQAFHWLRSELPNGIPYERMYLLGQPPHGTDSAGLAITPDGKIIGGHAEDLYAADIADFGYQRAMVWDETHGMRWLRPILVDQYGLGAELTGWKLGEVVGISSDNLFIYIAGNGRNPQGKKAGWWARVLKAQW